MTLPELYPEHDLFIQQMKLKNTLRAIMGEELMIHLGLDYCEQAREQVHRGTEQRCIFSSVRV